MTKRLGLIINPLAGIGGAVGLKGSDGPTIQQEALARGAVKKAGEKTKLALEQLIPLQNKLTVYAAPGEMGANLATNMGFTVEVVPVTNSVKNPPEHTTAADTEAAAQHLASLPVDLLLFAGGDGTARNIAAAVPIGLPVVGVPAGVKIHSGVYATNPRAAGSALVAALSTHVPLHQAEVMDIDEEAYRSGRLQARLFGYLSVPSIKNALQNPKAASHHAAHDVDGICHELADRIKEDASPDTCYIFGAGSTTNSVLEHLGHQGTLLGIDILQNNRLIQRDVAEQELLNISNRYPCKLIVTVIGGQGHIFGRGNQQLSPQVIRLIGLEHLWIVATAAKIFGLDGQCLYVDTGDETLDTLLRGYRRVIVGYQETFVCQVK